MPHKRNPVLSENLSGLARLMRAYALAALEDIPLWHERDISHSSVERVIAPDATTALDFMMARFTGVMSKLLIYPDRMKKNLGLTGGLIFSQRLLLLLIEKGLDRDQAYRIVQGRAMEAWEKGRNFQELIMGDEEVTSCLTPQELVEAFTTDYFLRHVDLIFERLFGAS